MAARPPADGLTCLKVVHVWALYLSSTLRAALGRLAAILVAAKVVIKVGISGRTVQGGHVW